VANGWAVRQNPADWRGGGESNRRHARCQAPSAIKIARRETHFFSRVIVNSESTARINSIIRGKRSMQRHWQRPDDGRDVGGLP